MTLMSKQQMLEFLGDIAPDGFVVASDITSPRARIKYSTIDSVKPQRLSQPLDPAWEALTHSLGFVGLGTESGFSPLLRSAPSKVIPIGMSCLTTTGLHAALLFGAKTNIADGETAAEVKAVMIDLVMQTKTEAEPSTKVTAYLGKIIDGFDDQSISEDLGLSLRAIKERKKKALEEFNAATLSHAVAIAMRQS